MTAVPQVAVIEPSRAGQQRIAADRLRGGSTGHRPKPAGRIVSKQPDGEPPIFLFRFYEAAVRDLTHPATS
jgi:hypothetical protein